MEMLPICTPHSLNGYWKLRWLRKWDNGMDINPERKTSNMTQHKEAFLKYVENDYYGKKRCLPAIIPASVPSYKLFSSTMASRSG
jgi:hypothetical protein